MIIFGDSVGWQYLNEFVGSMARHTSYSIARRAFMAEGLDYMIDLLPSDKREQFRTSIVHFRMGMFLLIGYKHKPDIGTFVDG